MQTTSFITLLGTAGVSIGLALQGKSCKLCRRYTYTYN
ncbi:MAG: hypothetical protein ACLUR5_04145 [Eubacterium ventriosum]